MIQILAKTVGNVRLKANHLYVYALMGSLEMTAVSLLVQIRHAKMVANALFLTDLTNVDVKRDFLAKTVKPLLVESMQLVWPLWPDFAEKS